jgi:hypothetical protein
MCRGNNTNYYYGLMTVLYTVAMASLYSCCPRQKQQKYDNKNKTKWTIPIKENQIDFFSFFLLQGKQKFGIFFFTRMDGDVTAM